MIVTANTCADGGTVARIFLSVFVHVSTAAGARDQASRLITGDMTVSGRASSQQRPDTAQVREPVLAVVAELGLGDLVAVELGLGLGLQVDFYNNNNRNNNKERNKTMS